MAKRYKKPLSVVAASKLEERKRQALAEEAEEQERLKAQKKIAQKNYNKRKAAGITGDTSNEGFARRAARHRDSLREKQEAAADEASKDNKGAAVASVDASGNEPIEVVSNGDSMVSTQQAGERSTPAVGAAPAAPTQAGVAVQTVNVGAAPASAGGGLSESAITEAANRAIEQSPLAGRLAALEAEVAALEKSQEQIASEAKKPGQVVIRTPGPPAPFTVRASSPDPADKRIEIFVPRNPTQTWTEVSYYNGVCSTGESSTATESDNWGKWYVIPDAEFGDYVFLSFRESRAATEIKYTAGVVDVQVDTSDQPDVEEIKASTRIVASWVSSPSFFGSPSAAFNSPTLKDETDYENNESLEVFKDLFAAQVAQAVSDGRMRHTVLVAYYDDTLERYVTLPGDPTQLLARQTVLVDLGSGSGGGGVVAVDAPVPWEVRSIGGNWWIYSPTVKYTTLSNLWGVQPTLPWNAPPAGRDGVKVTTPLVSEDDATGDWLQLTNADTDVSAKQLQATYDKEEGTVALELVTGASEEITSAGSWVVGSFSSGGEWRSNIVGAVSVDVTKTTPPMVKTVTGSGSSESTSMVSDVSSSDRVYLGVTYWVETLVVGGAVRFAKALAVVASPGVSVGLKRPVWMDSMTSSSMKVGGYAAFFLGATDGIATIATKQNIAAVTSLSYTEPTEDYQQGKLGSMNQTHYTWAYQCSSETTESVYLYTEVEDANNDGGEDPTNPYTDQGTDSASLVYQHGE